MRAAVPRYLNDVSDAAPGHRFGLYYAGWNDNFSKPNNGATPVLQALCALPGHSRALLAALADRQQTLADGERIHAIPCIATSPFATGLGNEHPLENGFSFLTPYGLPYLPGSGVKGVVRRAAEELDSGEWGDPRGWNKPLIRVLFGPGEDDPDRDENPSQGALRFWDVFPEPEASHRDDKNLLAVEIMTPHHGDYYRGERGPHTSESPIPISFLGVAARSRFRFYVECHPGLLPQELRETWRGLLDAAFEQAGQWLGFGAKTAVGYGRMRLDEDAITQANEKRKVADEQARQQAEQQQREAELAAMSPFERSIREVLDRRPKDQQELKALFNAFKAGEWQDDEKWEIASRLKLMLTNNKQWREKSEKKKPEKDEPYQMTLAVNAALGGKNSN